jgi:hypothetical protein
MNERANPFANLSDPPVFTTKPKTEKLVEEGTITRIAADNNFTSRQPAKTTKVEKRKPRTYRTGRNVQFNCKVTAETNAKIYKLADEREITLGELLELGMAALERDTKS